MRHAFGGNVVSMVQRGAAVTYPAVTQVDAYWEGLRKGRPMPERAEVDPRGLESALQFAFMLEQVAPGVARIRVAGMHLSDLLGMEVRGMPLSAFFEPSARQRFGEILDKVVAEPQVAELRLSSDRGIGRPALEAGLYLAPLSNGGLGHPRILGCLQSDGQIGRAPRRFTIAQVHLRRIVAAAGGQAPAPAAAAPEKNQLAEPAAHFRHAPARSGEKPKLRLVKSD